MTTLIQKTKSVRKTFTVPNYISQELEEYALSHNQKQSQIVSLALEEYLNKNIKKQNVEKKLNALHSLVGIAPKGSLIDLDTKKINNEKALKYVK